MQDFSELSPREVLALAIAVETRNRDYYKEFAVRLSTYDTAAQALLEELAEEEEAHRSYLVKRYFEQFGDSVIRIEPDEVSAELELRELPGEHFFVIDENMARRILEAALDNENRALQFYQCVLAATRDQKLKLIYEPLAQFEAEHVRVIEERIRAL